MQPAIPLATNVSQETGGAHDEPIDYRLLITNGTHREISVAPE
jgi:hypothetical protein